MKHLFLSKELSQLAKDKGFDEPCLAVWAARVNSQPNAQRELFLNNYYEAVNKNNVWYTLANAPLYQQIIDWFRHTHQIWVTADLLPNMNKYAGTFVPLSFKRSNFDSTLKWLVARGKYSTHSHDEYYTALNEAIENAFKLIP